MHQGSGDWFTDGNWSSHVPCSTTDASINNGGQAQINIQGAIANSLTLGNNWANSGAVSIDGTNYGNLLLAFIYVGYQGAGTVNIINGGTLNSVTGYIAASTSTSGPSKGSVTVTGSSSTLQVSNRLFVGGNVNEDGGTALLSITTGGSVTVGSQTADYSVKVGPSGTVSGNGTLDVSSSHAPLITVLGTLAPNWTVTIGGNLSLETSATTNCKVSPQNAPPMVDVSVSGAATLNGRLLVTMTGTFTTPADFRLLHASTLAGQFSSYSFTYTGCLSPSIVYDYVNGYVILHVESTCQ